MLKHYTADMAEAARRSRQRKHLTQRNRLLIEINRLRMEAGYNLIEVRRIAQEIQLLQKIHPLPEDVLDTLLEQQTKLREEAAGFEAQAAVLEHQLSKLT